MPQIQPNPTRAAGSGVCRRLFILAVSVAALLSPAPGQEAEPVGPPPAAEAPFRLVYDLSPYDLGKLLDRRPETDLGEVVADTLTVLVDRLDYGVAKFHRLGGTQFAVDARGDDNAVRRLRRHIEHRGRLEMQPVAFDGFERDGAVLDLAADRQRLRDWLDAGGRDAVLADPHALDAFHGSAERDELARSWVRWRLHRVRRAVDRPGQWAHALAAQPSAADASVALFATARWNGGLVPADETADAELVECVALLTAERCFSDADLEPRSVRALVTDNGMPAVDYRLRAEARDEFADQTGRFTHHHQAFSIDDEVESAPILVGRITGRGRIAVASRDQAEWMERLLQTRALPATPVLLRVERGGRPTGQ